MEINIISPLHLLLKLHKRRTQQTYMRSTSAAERLSICLEWQFHKVYSRSGSRTTVMTIYPLCSMRVFCRPSLRFWCDGSIGLLLHTLPLYGPKTFWEMCMALNGEPVIFCCWAIDFCLHSYLLMDTKPVAIYWSSWHRQHWKVMGQRYECRINLFNFKEVADQCYSTLSKVYWE